MSKGIVEASGRLVITGVLLGGTAGVGVAWPVGAVIGGAVGAVGALGVMALLAAGVAVADVSDKLKK